MWGPAIALGIGVAGLAGCSGGGRPTPAPLRATSTTGAETTTSIAPMRLFCQAAVALLHNITTALDADAPLHAAAGELSRAQQAALDTALRNDRLAPPASTISEGMEPSVSNQTVVALVNNWCDVALPVTSKPASP